jgi:cyclophilin family peptidyl-prolyl cis-trans isomerase/HEAT repeat protein
MHQAIFEAEDRRASTEAELAVLIAGSRDADPNIQRLAVRALGRIERPTLVPSILPLLDARVPAVREEAANALGQTAPGTDEALRGEIAGVLISRLDVEQNPSVRGVLCETIGRLPYAAATGAARAEAALLAAARPTASAGVPGRVAIVHGVVKGLEALLRRNQRLFTPAPETVEWLRHLVVAPVDDRPGADTGAARRVRRLALAALTSARQLDRATFMAAARDRDAQVRRLALAAIGALPAGAESDELRARAIRTGLEDSEWIVRFEALRAHARSLTRDGADWEPVFAALSDASAHVALLAIDTLGSAPPHVSAAVARLRVEAGSLPPAAPAPRPAALAKAGAALGWHRAAHALVALARTSPTVAQELLPAFLSSPAWPVRMYAARAAVVLRDGDALRLLADDFHDNVRDAAIGGLHELAGHGADGFYVRALARPDYQVVMTAARALEATPQPGPAVRALLGALARITAERRDTSRDPRLALLSRIGELGQPGDAPALAAYTQDFDPKVASAAAAIIGRWTGVTPPVSPQPLPVQVSGVSDIDSLRSAQIRVTVAGRGTFELQLLTEDAPASAARFARLARSGYYDGLTFHRVVPPGLLQGGSPGANEYVGDGPFLRDEIGLASHVRGAIGISTRGRDTGDAQFFISLIDNPRWDHDYTVFARVTAGLDVLDRVLECDVIERVDVIAR